MAKDRTGHYSEEQLTRLADGDIAGDEAGEIRAHLGSCIICAEAHRQIEAAIADYHRYHHEVLKPSLPVPPAPWEDLRARIDEIESAEADEPIVRGLPSMGRPARRAFPLQWLAVAAALVAAVLAVYRLQQPPRVSAAELLQKAVSAESGPSGPARKIKITTRKRTLVRAASLRTGAAAEAASAGGEGMDDLQAMFKTAQYSWDEPLSARSYAAWREQLPDMRDEVRAAEEADVAVYRVRTTTHHGSLTEATLTLRASDLRPVRGTLHFRNQDWVEISEVAEPVSVAAVPEAASTPPPPAANAVPEPAGGARLSVPALELHALAALHNVRADLGEPVELVRQGSKLTVVGTGLRPQRQREIREALAAVPGVEVRFHEPRPVESAAARDESAITVSPRPANSIQLELETTLGSRDSVEHFVNSVLESSEAMMARAHAVRALAERFSPEVERGLAAADRELLTSLRREHARMLAARAASLAAMLREGLPRLSRDTAPRTANRPGEWQRAAGNVFAAAGKVDALLTTMLAGSGADFSGRLPELRDALALLLAETNAFSSDEAGGAR